MPGFFPGLMPGRGGPFGPVESKFPTVIPSFPRKCIAVNLRGSTELGVIPAKAGIHTWTSKLPQFRLVSEMKTDTSAQIGMYLIICMHFCGFPLSRE